MSRSHKTPTFRLETGQLVAVSAFDHETLRMGRVAREAWRRQVLGIDSPQRGVLVANGPARGPIELRISEYVLRRTYHGMLALRPAREIVSARVHEDNVRSIQACKRVGLERVEREGLGETHWRMLGRVDQFIDWP